jgi:hypothetical protein
MILRFTIVVLMLTTVEAQAQACTPAPTCWIKRGGDYLRGICRMYEAQGTRLHEIARTVEEPERIMDFDRACRRLGVRLKSSWED